MEPCPQALAASLHGLHCGALGTEKDPQALQPFAQELDLKVGGW